MSEYEGKLGTYWRVDGRESRLPKRILNEYENGKYKKIGSKKKKYHIKK